MVQMIMEAQQNKTPDKTKNKSLVPKMITEVQYKRTDSVRQNKNKSLVPITLEHGDQTPELNPKTIPRPLQLLSPPRTQRYLWRLNSITVNEIHLHESSAAAY
jgi:hypothetical protein